ncbi:MAG: NAD-dependent epimerase/dehydratase family protein [Gammaproteobacteria bacterium]
MATIFITGATGYIGGSVAARLLGEGHHIIGLARSEDSAYQLRDHNIEPLIGALDDSATLSAAARRCDAVINAANADHRGAVENFIDALAGSNKLFIHTSGSSLVSSNAGGEPASQIFDEDTPVQPAPEKAPRVAINELILAAAQRGVRSVVICPSLIYGRGLGAHKLSIQIPLLIAEARKHGVARHIGRGENIWSNVHIEDLADLYWLAFECAPAGSFFYAENGEATMKEAAVAVSRLLGLGDETESWPLADAIQELGEQRAAFSLGSNSRVRAKKARELLGWKPSRPALLADITNGAYLLAD